MWSDLKWKIFFMHSVFLNIIISMAVRSQSDCYASKRSKECRHCFFLLKNNNKKKFSSISIIMMERMSYFHSQIPDTLYTTFDTCTRYAQHSTFNINFSMCHFWKWSLNAQCTKRLFSRRHCFLSRHCFFLNRLFVHAVCRVITIEFLKTFPLN